MTKYDPKVIQEYADHLYSAASGVILTYTLLGALGAAGPAYFATHDAAAAIVAALVFGGMGYQLAQSKAFQLRLQAQLALCDVETEKNTRRSSGAICGTCLEPIQEGAKVCPHCRTRLDWDDASESA